MTYTDFLVAQAARHFADQILEAEHIMSAERRRALPFLTAALRLAEADDAGEGVQRIRLAYARLCPPAPRQPGLFDIPQLGEGVREARS